MSRRIGTILKIASAIGGTAAVVVLVLFVVAPDLLFGGASTSATETFLRMKTSVKVSIRRMRDMSPLGQPKAGGIASRNSAIQFH
jgi:hypothetical protein